MGTTAEGCVWDGRESCQDGPGARAKLIKEPPAAGDQGLGTSIRNAPTGRTKSRWACGLLVGGLDFRVCSRQEAHRRGNDSSKGGSRQQRQALGSEGLSGLSLSFMR